MCQNENEFEVQTRFSFINRWRRNIHKRLVYSWFTYWKIFFNGLRSLLYIDLCTMLFQSNHMLLSLKISRIIQILFGWNDFDNHAQLWTIVEFEAFALLNIIFIRYGHIRKLSCYVMTVNKYFFVLFLWNFTLTKGNFNLYRYYSNL